MFIPHTKRISIQALKQSTPACGVPGECLGHLSRMVPCIQALDCVQVLEVTPLKPYLIDFVFAYHHNAPCPFLSNPSQACWLPSPSPIIPSLKVS